MRDIFTATLLEIARRDPRITLITGDLGFGVLDGFRDALPDQFVNAGVAEQNMTALAAGMALEGQVVFTYSIGNFVSLRCLEQIRNDAAYHGAAVKVVSIGGGFTYGALGMSHHATEDLAILRALPGVTVFAPSTDAEVIGLTQAAAAAPGVSYLRLERTSAVVPAALDTAPVIPGKARRLRQGSDLTIMTCGGLVAEALAAAEILERQGVSARVVSLHTLKPLDEVEIAAAARETSAIITVEEHSIIGGLGGAVAECCLEADVRPRRFRRLGLRDTYSSVVGSQEYLRSHYGMDAAAIVAAAGDALGLEEAAA